MAEQEWIRPEAPLEGSGAAWGRKQESRFELRPLSLGELLDRTFAIYRSRFWLFAGIAMVAASVNVVGQAFSLTAARHVALHTAVHSRHSMRSAVLAGLQAGGGAQWGSALVLTAFVLVSAMTHAATALALTEVYLGRPTSVQHALSQVVPRWLRWIGIAIWQSCSFVWIPLAAMIPAAILLAYGTRTQQPAASVVGGVLLFAAIFAGFPAGVVLYLRNALAVPAAVTEGLPVRQAMRRSKVLAAGSKGRIFVVLLIAGCLLDVVAVLGTPVRTLIVRAPNEAHYLARGLALLLTFAGNTVVAPVALIGLTLVYFDQRVRKEAFDLELMLEQARGGTGEAELRGGVMPPPPPPQPPAAPEGYAPLG